MSDPNNPYQPMQSSGPQPPPPPPSGFGAPPAPPTPGGKQTGVVIAIVVVVVVAVIGVAAMALTRNQSASTSTSTSIAADATTSTVKVNDYGEGKSPITVGGMNRGADPNIGFTDTGETSSGARDVKSLPTAQAETNAVLALVLPGSAPKRSTTPMGKCPDGKPGGVAMSSEILPNDSAPLKAPAVIDKLKERGWTVTNIQKGAKLDRVLASLKSDNAYLYVQAMPATGNVPDFVEIDVVVACDQPQLVTPPTRKRDPQANASNQPGSALFPGSDWQPPADMDATTKLWMAGKNKFYTSDEMNCIAKWLTDRPEKDAVITRKDQNRSNMVWAEARVGCLPRIKMIVSKYGSDKSYNDTEGNPLTNCVIDVADQMLTNDQLLIQTSEPLQALFRVGQLFVCPDYVTR